MADFVFNIAKGRVAELALRVKNNDPANSALVVVPVDVGATTDATLRDFTTLAAVLGGGATERTTGGWTRKTLDDTILGTIAPDQTNDRFDITIPNQTWTAVTGATLTTTDILVCYRPDTTAGTDSSLIPLTCHDAPFTPDGSDLVVQIAAAGFYRAS